MEGRNTEIIENRAASRGDIARVGNLRLGRASEIEDRHIVPAFSADIFPPVRWEGVASSRNLLALSQRSERVTTRDITSAIANILLEISPKEPA